MEGFLEEGTPETVRRSEGFLKKDFIYLFLEGKGGTKRGRETSMCEKYIGWLPLACSQLWTGPATQAHALEWESNLQPFGLQAGAQSTEPHQPGKLKNLKMSLDIS